MSPTQPRAVVCKDYTNYSFASPIRRRERSRFHASSSLIWIPKAVRNISLASSGVLLLRLIVSLPSLTSLKTPFAKEMKPIPFSFEWSKVRRVATTPWTIQLLELVNQYHWSTSKSAWNHSVVPNAYVGIHGEASKLRHSSRHILSDGCWDELSDRWPYKSRTWLGAIEVVVKPCRRGRTTIGPRVPMPTSTR